MFKVTYWIPGDTTGVNYYHSVERVRDIEADTYHLDGNVVKFLKKRNDSEKYPSLIVTIANFNQILFIERIDTNGTN